MAKSKLDDMLTKLPLRRGRRIALSPFRKKALEVMLKIPEGTVASYAQIGELAGKPHSAREVAWLLHHLGHDLVPWHRVIGSSGKVMFPKRRKEFREQIQLLRAEGILISNEGFLAMEKYRWKKKPRRKKADPSKPKMFSS